MMKVCHVTNVHPPEDVRIFHKECISLSKKGYEVYLVQQGESYEKEGVHLIGFGHVASNRIKRMLTTARLAYKKALEVNADIYHIHDPELLPYALKLKKRGKKVIFDSHEHTAEAIFEKEWLPKALRKIIYVTYSAFQKRICSKIDGVISVTPNIVEYFKKINGRTVQVANYPIYVETPRSDIKKKQVVFAGGISEQWGHEKLLEALAVIPECRYCLCGKGDESFISKLKTHSAWKQVDYIGKVPFKQVAGYLDESMIGVALLRPGRNTDWEKGTIGNTKIFEEMMAGLPVICTDFVLWKEFVERYSCGICIDPTNVKEIISAIRFLLDNPENAAKMGENGRRAIRDEFNWDNEATKLYKFYEEIIQ